MAVGILGGVFDPPHVGHVALARAALAELELDELLVLVVADPGHKTATTPAETRLELAQARVRGRAGGRRSSSIVTRGPSTRSRSGGRKDAVLHPRCGRARVASRAGSPRSASSSSCGSRSRCGRASRAPRSTPYASGSARATASSSSRWLRSRSRRPRSARASRAARASTDDVPAAVAEAIARLGLYATPE